MRASRVAKGLPVAWIGRASAEERAVAKVDRYGNHMYPQMGTYGHLLPVVAR